MDLSTKVVTHGDANLNNCLQQNTSVNLSWYEEQVGKLKLGSGLYCKVNKTQTTS